MQIATLTLGSHPRVTSDVCLDFPADEYSAPDLAILREDAQRNGKRFGFEDVLLVVDPYAREVLVHTSPTGDGYITTHTHKYGTGKLPVPEA
ncbi:hypothetical protein PV682_40185 [Streptomyces niveiscabiei]|uniref:hypothetical protein n=1 Tax=Streptomyces niveiscabiei TaxID=164115 RepID=UPI0029A2B99F|nr:hypothetical protein [Streptomyces niveiscabiei]MDX3387620.1 hypothetical protein [Streptomyces niveiscabiei]